MTSVKPLIRMEGTQWVVMPEGRELLLTAKKPMKVIAVAGLYRTGKSFFLNTIAGCVGSRSSEGFGVGSTSESCTRGIDIHIQSADASGAAGSVTSNDEGSEGSLVLLDTEGLASMEQDESYDAQIFALAVLLSSFFVLNSVGVIDEAALDRLFLISELSKHVCVQSGAPQTKNALFGVDSHTKINGDESNAIASAGGVAAAAPSAGFSGSARDLAAFFPPFLWLLRDLVVELSVDGSKIDEATYLEKALEPRPSSARRAAERNETRAAIRDLFPVRYCRTLVRPASDEEAMRHAVALDESQLRPEFVRKMKSIKQEILSRAPPKSLYGEALDGAMLIALTERYVQAMNAPGAMPCIRSAWESVVEERCREAAGRALQSTTDALVSACATTPLPSSAAWADAAASACCDALCEFDAAAIAGAHAAAARNKLARDVLAAVKDQTQKLVRASEDLSRDVASSAAEALPQPTADVNVCDSLGLILSVCEGRAAGPAAALALQLALRQQLQPWLKLVKAATDARGAETLQELNAAKRQVTMEEAAAAALKGQLDEERRRRAEEAAAWQQRLEAAAAAAAALRGAESERAQSELQAERMRATSAEASAAEARAARDATSSELAESRAERDRISRDLGGLRSDLDASRSEISALRQSAMALQAEKAELDAEVSRLQSELVADRSSASRRIDEATSRVTQIEAELSKQSKAAEAALKAQRSLKEERDELKQRLADFSERASVLPPFYAQQIFASEKPPEDFMDALTSAAVSERDGAPAELEELRERAATAAEDIAYSQLGNIAALTSWGVKRATPLAQRTWSSFFGSAAQDDANAQAEAKAGQSVGTVAAPGLANAAAAPPAPASASAKLPEQAK